MKRVYSCVVLACLASMTGVHGLGQITVNLGTPPFGSFTGGPDVINLGSLNAHWNFPIVTKAGRGQSFAYSVPYDSTIWTPFGVSGSQVWTPPPATDFGWPIIVAQSTGLPGQIYYTTSTQQYYVPCIEEPNPPYEYVTVTTYTNWSYIDGSNTTHNFPGIQTWSVSPTCNMFRSPQPSVSGTSADGFHISVTAYTSAAVTSKSGTVVTPGSGSICSEEYASGNTDSFGNVISEVCGVYTDTLGQTALTITGGTSSPPVVMTQSNNTGTSTYTLAYSPYTVQTNFGCSGVTEYGPTAQELPSSLTLADGRKYTFTYEPTYQHSANTTGRIASVTLPSGGEISYIYSTGSSGVNGITCSDGTASAIQRTTPDGTTTYARSNVTSTSSVTTITYPSYAGVQNQTLIAFIFSSPNGGEVFYEVARQVYSGSTPTGTLLETILTCYDTSFSSCATSAGTNGSTAIADNGAGYIPGYLYKTIQLSTSTGAIGISSGTEDVYDSVGNNTKHIVYDYGSAGSGIPSTTALQTTNTTYASFPYSGESSFPSEVTVLDSAGSKIADAINTYSSSGLIATSGTPQHITPYNYLALTSVQNLVSGTTYQTSTNTYYDTGNVSVATDVNGEQTTYTYGGCSNSFPTSVSSQTGGTVVTSLTTQASWNCVGGVMLTSYDVNTNETTYAYGSDPYWRPVTVTNNATTAVTSYTYPTTSSNSSSLAMNFNGTTSTSTSVTTYDGLGRTLVQQTKQSPSATNYDTVATAYDSLGRVATQTLPYSGTLGDDVPTNPGTTTTYDPLNRPTEVADSGGGTKAYTYAANDVEIIVGPVVTSPGTENLKKRNLQYNGAGWLTSVCEIIASTLPAGGACGQTTAYTGYLTTYTYDGGRLTEVQQNNQPGSTGVQTRTVAYDDLGRKTSETIPEWSAGTGSAGTTTYTYDSASACTGTSTGDLVETVDNIGNATCFTYDKLHRPTSSQVISGSYASVTPLTYAVYDAATYSGTAMQNAKGQVAEAYTCSTSACTTKLTDAFFSASPVTTGVMAGGVESDMWESTPHSSGYFHTTDTYFPNGAVGSIAALLGTSSIGIPSLTFGVDGEGRPYSATDGTHSLNLVTATAYNPASSPTSITYGNASTGSANDVDSFTYDPNTHRPTNLTYAINPTTSPYTVTTALTWNGNWSLQKMVYTDGNDATKDQTCTYSADDLSRIASTSCGTSTWGQTFTYDPFGNIKKTIPSGYSGSAYAAAYSTVTNQVSSGITPAPTYDKNGNQTTSTPATLTWNALNQPITVNSTSATYDALGRMVEKGLSGTYTQFVFRPSGAILAVYSGSLVKGTVPLPGGSTAIYNASGLSYIRHTDWLGSSRLATTWAHAVYSKEAYAPFGETYNEAGTADRSFTGQDQDVVTGSGGSGVYDFLFRKYDPSAGRWLSPDPNGWGAENLRRPQSLNRYAYVQNNPMSLSDPNGLDCIEPDGSVISGDCPEDADGNPTDDGVYIDCDGCVLAGTGTFDDNGNLNGYCTTDGSCYNGDGSPATTDPDAPTFQVNGWGTPLNDNVQVVSEVVALQIPYTSLALLGGMSGAPSNSIRIPGIKIGIANYIFNGMEGNQCQYMLYCPNGNTHASCGTQVPTVQVDGPPNNVCSNYLHDYRLVVGGSCFPVGKAELANFPVPCQ